MSRRTRTSSWLLLLWWVALGAGACDEPEPGHCDCPPVMEWGDYVVTSAVSPDGSAWMDLEGARVSVGLHEVVVSDTAAAWSVTYVTE
jgi:hypothetical protein